jgi:hypothetical protein
MKRTKRDLQTIDPSYDIAWQIDARFEPLFKWIPDRHHDALFELERDVVNLVKRALQQSATRPAKINPDIWPGGGVGSRLEALLADEDDYV